jgi:tetraacyldisaccharide 4'-kinase
MKYLSYILFPFSFIYSAFASLRNYLYNSGFIGSARFELPIITIGNLSTGGTGKTMLTAYLALLLGKKYSLGVLSRGYRRNSSGYKLVRPFHTFKDVGDEPKLLSLKYPWLNVAVDERRILGIPALMHDVPYISAILLDDAFQHLSVKAHLNILLTNYDQPYWEDFVLPMGSLRESRNGANRADIIIVNKCPKSISAEMQNKIIGKINPKPNQKVFFAYLRYDLPYNICNPNIRHKITENEAILVVTGVAEPLPLVRYLQTFTEHIYWQRYVDHHHFDKLEIIQLIDYYNAISKPNKILITTEKDAIRLIDFLPLFEASGISIFAIPVTMNFINSTNSSFDNYMMDYMSFFYPEESNDAYGV